MCAKNKKYCFFYTILMDLFILGVILLSCYPFFDGASKKTVEKELHKRCIYEDDITRIDYVDDNNIVCFCAETNYASLIIKNDGDKKYYYYYDEKGNPHAQNYGECGRIEYINTKGHPEQIVYLDADWHPFVNTSGYMKATREYSANGRTFVEKYYGTDNQWVSIKDGRFATRYEYDESDRLIFVQYLGANGKAIENIQGISCIKYVRDVDGTLKTEMYYDAKMQPVVLKNGSSGIRYVNEKKLYIDKNGYFVMSLDNIAVFIPCIVVLIALVLCIIILFIPERIKICLLLAYLMYIVIKTLAFRGEVHPPNFHLFWSYIQFFSNSELRKEIINNVWLFVPLGALLYSLLKNKFVFLITMLLSLTIEMFQWQFGLGLFELDDIVSNTIGGMVGELILISLMVKITLKNANGKVLKKNI